MPLGLGLSLIFRKSGQGGSQWYTDLLDLASANGYTINNYSCLQAFANATESGNPDWLDYSGLENIALTNSYVINSPTCLFNKAVELDWIKTDSEYLRYDRLVTLANANGYTINNNNCLYSQAQAINYEL